MSARDDTLAEIATLERRAKLAEMAGGDAKISMRPIDLMELCQTARQIMAYAEATAIVERALKNIWAFAWFVLGAIFMAILR